MGEEAPQVHTHMRCLKCQADLYSYTNGADFLAADMDAMCSEMVKHLNSECSHRTDPSEKETKE